MATSPSGANRLWFIIATYYGRFVLCPHFDYRRRCYSVINLVVMRETTIATVFSPAQTENETNNINVVQSPLYSSAPAAGFPAPGDDMVEKELNVHDLLVKHPASTFFVRVEGDSMEGAGIFSGDILVVDRAVEAKVGRVVVAVVDGGLVVKRLAKLNRQLILVSENVAYAPIVVGEDEECFVWGVVTGSVRQF